MNVFALLMFCLFSMSRDSMHTYHDSESYIRLDSLSKCYLTMIMMI